MPWNDTARIEHRRDAVRYPSDLKDREWALIAPLLPPAKRGGRPRTTDLRSVVDAIVYVASSGCQWRMLPKDFPPVSTVQGYFYAWRDSGLWQGLNHLLVMSTRELEGREASPTAGVIDSQGVKTTESGGVCGYDAGKKVKGRKRHIMTDIHWQLRVTLANARVGKQGSLTYVWADKGSWPRAPRDQRYAWAYLFGAVCPARGIGAALVLPASTSRR